MNTQPVCRKTFYIEFDVIKSETFSNLLNLMSITVDREYLESEYFSTLAGKGRVYEYKSANCSIAFDFRTDPTAQIECCGISLSFPNSLSEQIMPLVSSLQNASKYVVNRVVDGDFDAFNACLKSGNGAHFERATSSNDWKEFKSRLQNEKITQPKSRVLLEKIFDYIKIALIVISVIVAIIRILQYCI